jgi:tRNA A37 threonylcarbamoyladenosine modification protein TsaB
MNLFIDTTQKKCNLAIFNNKIIDYISILTNNNLTDLVIEEINKLLKKNKINIKNITSLYLTIGPGSFTGVRIGCIIAKA